MNYKIFVELYYNFKTKCERNKTAHFKNTKTSKKYY